MVNGAADYFTSTYGARAKGVLERTVADPSAKAPLDPELPYLTAQVDEAVEHEFALTLDDVLSRRIPLVLRGRDQGLGIAQQVADRMAAKLEWTPERTAKEVEAYRATVANSRAFREG